MDRYAIFLDAGYFFSAGAQVAEGRKIQRKLIALKAPEKAIVALCSAAAPQANNIPLLRTYWYDAMPGPRLSLEQSNIAMLPCVKLRLGVLNNVGEQKGVDSLIVTDLIELARNGAITDAVIVSGDEDLRIAVQVAQSFGVRVHILAAGDPKKNVSTSLQMEADSVDFLPKEWFVQHFLINTPPPPTPLMASPGTTLVPESAELSVDDAAEKISAELLTDATDTQILGLQTHFATSHSVPQDFDRRLIAKTASLLSERKFSGDEMRKIRGVFVNAVKAKTS
jgi:uncharacterized LabA/DUF88 family protein